MNKKNAYFMYSLFLAIVVLIFLYSPLISLFLFITILIFGDKLNIYFRYFLSVGSIFFISIISSSRLFSTSSSSDDFVNVYWPAYQEISTSILFQDGFSLNGEIVYPLFLHFLNWIFGGDLNQYQFFFIHVFTAGLLFYIWLEKFGLNIVSEDKKSLCIAITIIFFEFFVTTQLIRQCYATILILFALSLWYQKKYIKSIIFYTVSVLTHFSSIIIFPIFLMLLSTSKKVRFFVIIATVISSITFYSFVNYALSTNLFGAATYKLLYYDAGLNKVNAAFYLELKFLIFAILLLLLCKFLKKDVSYLKKENNILILSVIMFSLLSVIPELSNRLFLLMLYILPGYFIAIYGVKLGKTFRVFIFIYLFIYIMNLMLFRGYENSLNTQSDFLGLWYNYQWIDSEILYYLKEF